MAGLRAVMVDVNKVGGKVDLDIRSQEVAKMQSRHKFLGSYVGQLGDDL